MVISDRALGRRVKRNLLNKEHDFLAVTALGNEQILLEELQSLETSLHNLSVIPGGVAFTAGMDVIYEANLWLSTANRLLLRIAEFTAPNTSAFYNRVKRISWEQFVGFADNLSFSISTRKSTLNHKRKLVDIAASAALSQLALHGLHPKVTSRKSSALEFLVRIDHNRCTISFNTSGTHLHKRGWRVSSVKAPMRETIAAGVLKRVGLLDKDLVVDPFCGSGTFPIEAARQLAHYPPGGNRTFAFENAPFFNFTKWTRIKETAIEAAVFDTERRYIGFDADPVTIDLATANARQAGVSSIVTFDVENAFDCNFSALKEHERSRCLFVTNLPYGTRLSTAKEVSVLTRTLADKLNAECRGWTVAIVLKNAEDLKNLRLQNRKVHQFLNGGLKVFLISGEVSE